MKTKFYKCLFFSYYFSKGLKWFKLFGVKISFKHIINYNFKKTDQNKGFFIGWWLITIT